MTDPQGLMWYRIDLPIPGAGSLTHYAELDASAGGPTVSVVRMIEFANSDHPTGLATATRQHNMNAPLSEVPHPRSYASYPDIDAGPISREEFETAWTRALQLFPDFH